MVTVQMVTSTKSIVITSKSIMRPNEMHKVNQSSKKQKNGNAIVHTKCYFSIACYFNKQNYKSESYVR